MQPDKELRAISAERNRIKAQYEALPAKERSGAHGDTLLARLQMLSKKAERLNAASNNRTILK